MKNIILTEAEINEIKVKTKQSINIEKKLRRCKSEFGKPNSRASRKHHRTRNTGKWNKQHKSTCAKRRTVREKGNFCSRKQIYNWRNYITLINILSSKSSYGKMWHEKEKQK